MDFRCRACGAIYSAMEWNNATRSRIEKMGIDKEEFLPIQNAHDTNRKWYCLSCSEDKPDVTVKEVG